VTGVADGDTLTVLTQNKQQAFGNKATQAVKLAIAKKEARISRKA